MWPRGLIVFCALLGGVFAVRRFPDGFKLGAATAAYQVEGSWNVSDKSPSIWDTFTHEHPEAIVDGSNGDIACDSYNKWREDIQLASDFGLHFYRLSLSWPRLLPNGFSNYISEDGVRYYNNLIDGLLEKGIEPLVTLYHWDLPQNLQDLGGWTNPLIAEWFAAYARVAYTLFGDRVKTWITINEGVIVCEATYTLGGFAPGISSPFLGSYMCNKNVLLAHARAWRIYDEEFRPEHHGKVSLTNQILWVQPYSEEYEELADLVMQMVAGLYSHPIYTRRRGMAPHSLEKQIAEKSAREGYKRSKLPAFTKEEIEFIKGTYDFYAVNYYTSRLVRTPKEGEKIGLWPLYGLEELGAVLEVAPEWPGTSSNWFFEYPVGLRRLLSWLKKNYGDLDFRIMENGYASDKRDINDYDRVKYYREHLEQVYLAITEDAVNVTHYTAWTLLDNYEWVDGYVSKFGIVDVDFTDPLRPRTPRASAYFYASVIATNSPDGDQTLNDLYKLLARTKNAIQRVQNACARYIWNIPLRTHVSPFLLSAGVLRMEQRRRLHFASLLFDVVLSKAPSYLYDKLSWFGDGNNRYHTRIALYGLEMPLYHTTAFRGSFAYNATKCWNNLPPPIRASKTVRNF
ncbi:unnamed protein product [Leptosia nina]|uniref:Myrosinase 1-like n=2 Tax=Leptosia nina TaxID=320188 RepID=A0AAV1J5F0_9NEOP